MYQTILHYVLMFFLYSAIGWTVECTYRSLGERRIINSGFLYGPMCPIYGTGAMVFEVLLTPLQKHWWAVLLVGIVAADAVEYLTSYLMEKLFHARWWDYSHEFLNIKGRICFKHTCYWALFSVLYVYFIRPVYTYAISFVPLNVQHIAVYVILALFLVDLFFTVIAAVSIQKFMNRMEALRLNVSMAAEVVRLHAENIRDSAESRYDEFIETVANNTERFEAWRGGVSEKLESLRGQLEEMTRRERKSPLERAVTRLFTVSRTMEKHARSNVDELAEQWKDVSEKLDK